MNLRELTARIGLPPEIVQKLLALRDETDLAALEPWIAQLTERPAAARAYEALDARLADDPGHLKMLLCQLEAARRVHGRYLEKGIPEDVFTDTMKCFTRFLGECRIRSGRMDFDRGWWTYRQTSMELFRVGALEYQLGEADGAPVIHLHIPSDADLSGESVDRSLALAKSFFKRHYPDYRYDRYVCKSWLLSPTLGTLLPEGSRIRAFQERFAIGPEEESTDFFEWLFQTYADAPLETLPEKTRLQRRVKELLLKGGSLGVALGTMKA